MKRDNVVAISSKLGERAPVATRQAGWEDCRHEHTEIDGVLRTIGCLDCGEQRLDPIEVLIHLGRIWHRWHREAEQLRELNAEYQNNKREKWERGRDRHLNAHPDHRASFSEKRTSWGPSWEQCRQCYRLEITWDRRWVPIPITPPDPPAAVDVS